MSVISLSNDNSHEFDKIKSLAESGKIKMVRVPKYYGSHTAWKFNELLKDGRVRFNDHCYIKWTQCEFVID